MKLFLHLSVILFTGGGLPQCMLGYPPPWAGTSPWAGTPPRQVHPLGWYPPPPPPMVTAVDGMHPTGILSYLIYIFTAYKRSLGQGNIFTGVFLSAGGGV